MDEKLAAVVAETLSLEVSQVLPSLALGDVPAWDSLGHLKLILAVEAAFGIRFRTGEIPELTSIAKIADRLARLGRGR